MIQYELLKQGTLIRHYSDSGKMIVQVETGHTYSEAIDIVPCPYTYEETKENAADADEQEISAEEALDIILGGEV